MLLSGPKANRRYTSHVSTIRGCMVRYSHHHHSCRGSSLPPPHHTHMLGIFIEGIVWLCLAGVVKVWWLTSEPAHVSVNLLETVENNWIHSKTSSFYNIVTSEINPYKSIVVDSKHSSNIYHQYMHYTCNIRPLISFCSLLAHSIQLNCLQVSNA